MKITKIRIDCLSVPLRHPYRLCREYGVLPATTPVIVSVFTDEGITGYGECNPWPRFTGDSAEICALTLEKHIAPAVIGLDPTNINAIHRAMDEAIRGQHLTKAAVDIACHDVWGKSENVPVCRLLGGELRKGMRCMWAVGGAEPEVNALQVLEAKQKGYDGCMIKIGGEDWKHDAARTAAIREAVGPDFPLIVDANQGWDVDTAVRYWKQIRHLDILFFEQPVQSWDVQGMAEVRRRIDIPVSADESVVTLRDARNLVEAGAADVFSIKVAKNGGIKPARELCDYADASGVQIFFNSMIEEGISEAASLQLGVTRPRVFAGIGHAYFSPNRLDGDICSYHEQIHPESGESILSDLPGLGVKLDEAAMKRYTTDTRTVAEV